MRSTTSSSPFAECRRALRAASIGLLSLIASGCGGCDSAGGSAGGPQAEARAAVDRGIAALLAAPGHDIGSLHALRRIGRLAGREDVLAFVGKERERFRTDLYRALLFEDAEPVPPLAAPGQGERRLQWYLTHAATRSDPERSHAVLQEFLALDLHGYLLTHQLYALVWMRDAGLSVPPAFEERKIVLLAALRREIEALPSFSDLFAEQVAVLLWSEPGVAIPDAWVEAVVRAQRKDGLFEDPTRYRISFDGASWDQRAPAVHTSAQAVLALAQIVFRKS